MSHTHSFQTVPEETSRRAPCCEAGLCLTEFLKSIAALNEHGRPMSDKVTMETVSAQHLQTCASANLLSGNGTLGIKTHTRQHDRSLSTLRCINRWIKTGRRHHGSTMMQTRNCKVNSGKCVLLITYTFY